MCPMIEKILSGLSPKNHEKFLELLKAPAPEPIYHEIYSINGERVYGTYWVEQPKSKLGNVNEYFYKDR